MEPIKFRASNLWDEYDAVEKECEAAEAKLEECMRKRSGVVKELLAANGGKKLLVRDGKGGPPQEFTVMVREKGDNHYLRTGRAGRPPKVKA